MALYPATPNGTKGEIDPNWTFVQAVNAAQSWFRGGNVTATQSRQSFLRTWGVAVGRDEAVTQLAAYVAGHATKQAAAEALWCGASALRALEGYFGRLSRRLSSVDPDTEEWLRRIPTDIPQAIRQAAVRAVAIQNIERAISDLRATEFVGIELGVMEELVLPGLERAVGALRLDDAIIQDWLSTRITLAAALGGASKGRRILNYGTGVLSVVSGVDTVIRWFEGLF